MDSLRCPLTVGEFQAPLLKLSAVKCRLDSVQQFLSASLKTSTPIGDDRMAMVSSEIASAIREAIVNGAALLACSQIPVSSQLIGTKALEIPSKESTSFTIGGLTGKHSSESVPKVMNSDLKAEEVDEEIGNDCDVIEVDEVELLAEHIHFCDICGKGFKRDANLRMHMRAHGNQFKTPEALAKPDRSTESTRRMTTRFSCPFEGCNRNKRHKKFRPLKSVICVKNHFKRSHCPKMFSCNRCNKKSFSVVADLKSHLKHCGETKWKCSCGTSFSRKDKLFGHMALFEGHMPAVVEESEKEKGASSTPAFEDEENENNETVKDADLGENSVDGFFEELLKEFGSIENFCLQDELDSPNGGLCNGMDWIL